MGWMTRAKSDGHKVSRDIPHKRNLDINEEFGPTRDWLERAGRMIQLYTFLIV